MFTKIFLICILWYTISNCMLNNWNEYMSNISTKLKLGLLKESKLCSIQM